MTNEEEEKILGGFEFEDGFIKKETQHNLLKI